MNLEQFHFLRPWWLLVLLPLALVLWLMVKKKLGSRGWEAFCDPNLLPHVLRGQPGGSRRLPVMLTAVCGLLAILALAGPVWNKLPQPVFSSQSALVIALDLTRSMMADDVSPSRLQRAKFKIRDLLSQRPDGRTALLVYTGDAFTVTPLTDDAETIVSQLQALTPDIMPVQGNRPDIALMRARDLMQQAGAGRGNVLVITDEVTPDGAVEAARELNRAGYRVSVMGVGTDHGVPIPLSDGRFLKNKQGEIVIPTLDEAPLQRLAEAGGGRYVRLQTENADVGALLEEFEATLTGEMQATELETDLWREQGPWLLILLLPLAALAFRRGYLMIGLCLILPYPTGAQAFDWDSLWWRDDQRGRQALKEGDSEEAARLFRDPAWKGVALYRSGDYEGAEAALQELEGADDLYNRGNALARTGRYQAAIEAYEKALEKDPEHEDAAYNKQLVEEALKQQQQRQQQQPSQNQEGEQQRQQEQSSGESNRQEGQQGQSRPGEEERRNDESESGQQNQEQQSQRRQDSEEQGQRPSRREPSRQTDVDGEEDTRSMDKQALSSDELTPDETQQALEQWLRRIPDDPGELLRRKFLYQYQRRRGEGTDGDKSW